MPLINFKVELKLKSTKYCALSAAVADNSDVNSNNIISQPKKQNYMFLLSIYQQKTIKSYANFLVKDL